MSGPEREGPQIEADARDLHRFGYVQELLRDMGGFSNFAVSFSVISILTGATQLYGYGLQHGGPLQMSLGWMVVSIFTMTVAMSMAELASAYPTAGALYHWSTYLGGRRLGWFTACFNSLGQFAILAGIDYGLAQFLAALFGWEGTQLTIGAIYAALLFSHAVLNHYGIRLISVLNTFSAWYHMAVVALLFGLLAYAGFVKPVSFLFQTHFAREYSPGYNFLIGLLLAQWTLTGYDASAHVTEETINPRVRAPWGVFWAVGVSVVFGLIMLVAMTLSITDLDQAVAFGDRAFAEILKSRLGNSVGTALMALVLGAMWLCGLAGMTSASRMIYAFSRDGGLPASKFLARVNPRTATPSYAIWALAVVALILAVSMKLYSAIVSVATIALYVSYGLPIGARLYAHLRHDKASRGPWHLGRWSLLVAWVALLWIGFITVLFVLPPNAQAGAVIGGFLVLLLVIWIFHSRRNFRGPGKLGFH